MSTPILDQTKVFYSWEDEHLPDCRKSYLSLAGCQKFVDEIWSDLMMVEPPPVVKDGRGSSAARSEGNTISMPRWSRNATVITHELSHTLASLIDPWGNINHNGVFIHVYFTMLTRYCDHKYHVLVNSALNHGLVITPVKIKNRLRPFTNSEYQAS